MQLIARSDIEAAIEKPTVIEAVREAFVQHAHSEIDAPAPLQMLFGDRQGDLSGDCHVKTASSSRLPYFCIKVASGFYNNPALGLEVNNGLLLLLSSETGQPLALLQDEGCLTAARTAAAGALAATLASDNAPKRLGIIGTGQQAEQQARWIHSHMDIAQVTVSGRTAGKAKLLAEKLSDLGLACRSVANARQLCAESDIIVTTTPATAPVLRMSDLQGGAHIVAVGADSPGKNELDPEILARADVIITDDHHQALDHGEFGTAVRAGAVREGQDLSLGSILADPKSFERRPDSLSVVDLTGLGAQDLAIASLIYEELVGAAQRDTT